MSKRTGNNSMIRGTSSVEGNPNLIEQDGEGQEGATLELSAEQVAALAGTKPNEDIIDLKPEGDGPAHFDEEEEGACGLEAAAALVPSQAAADSWWNQPRLTTNKRATLVVAGSVATGIIIGAGLVYAAAALSQNGQLQVGEAVLE